MTTTARHVRLQELLDELNPELEGRGFTRNPAHALWAKNRADGLLTFVVSFAPDDEEGGWAEPFLGIIDERVETLVATHTNAPVTYGLRHTLLVGASRWLAGPLPRQPLHTTSETLEAANVMLRWMAGALESFGTRFPAESQLEVLDEFFNTESAEARRYLQHDLYRALRGVAIRSLTDPDGMTDAMSFHRSRMQETGFWEAYGEQVRAFVMALT